MLHHMLHYMLHRIGELDRIVMMKGKWLKMIYNKKKDIEVRNNGKTVLGLRIFFCESGTSIVSGYAVVADVLGPLSSQDWEGLRDRHCIPGGLFYKKGKNYGWVLKGVKRLRHPVRIARKDGSVGSQIGPGAPLFSEEPSTEPH
jgi:hypothetical protein